MVFVQFTRPDGTPVAVNTAEVFKFEPVPSGGPNAGPLSQGTRIHFNNGRHQDVKELQAAVLQKLSGT